MRSSKQAAAAAATATENNRGISGHMFTLHQRLYHALNLDILKEKSGNGSVQILKSNGMSSAPFLPSLSLPRQTLYIILLLRDIILKPKETESICWKCRTCSLSLPHMHAHKVVLSSSCDYLRALFQSGMQESRSQTIEVPVSWEAMIKLVNWFYTDELPKPSSGCLWDNMDDEEKLHQLQQYLELCWLAEFWFLEDVQDISYKVIVSCLDSARQLSIKIIKIASELSLWKLAEVAANYLAPFYRQLCHTGDLEALNEELVDMIRDASVRLSQEG